MEIDRNINIAINDLETEEKSINTQIKSLNTKILVFSYFAWGFIILGFIIGAFGIWYYITRPPFLSPTPPYAAFTLNLLGDYFAGTITSLWSLAGLFFIYVAFLGQKQQLLLQRLDIQHSRLDIKLTRFELTGQKKEMIEQNRTLRQQRFENTFFNLLSLHHQIVDSIDIDQEVLKRLTHVRSDNSYKGRDVFKKTYNYLMARLTTIDNINSEYQSIYIHLQSDFGHYFRNLYRMIKLVDESVFIASDDIEFSNLKVIENENMKEKYKYTSIIRSQLSDYELLWLFYNCLSINGKNKFKPLIEKYTLLKNLSIHLLHNELIKSAYSENAYIKS